MKMSKMHARVANRNRSSRTQWTYAPPGVVTTANAEQGHYGQWGWEGPNKADKGHRLGSCNVTRCQRPGAFWYNRVMRAWYCTGCAMHINYRPLEDGSYLCSRDEGAENEYFERLEAE